MRGTLFLCLFVYFSFTASICAAKDELPPWVFENQEGLYLGVSEVMDDAGLALLQAQTRAVLNYCLTEGLPFETITTSEINAEGEKESVQRLEATRLELSGFECALEKLYAHPSGEYFVLCRVKQGKSNNKINFSRDVNKKSHSRTDSCMVKSQITTTLEQHSYSESIVYDQNNGKEEITVKVGKDILSDKANYRYAEYTPRANKEKTALKFTYNLQHSFGRAWIGALTQIPLCNKEVIVKNLLSSFTKTNEKGQLESTINATSKLLGKAEGLPFPLCCTGITKGQLIMEAGIYGTVEEISKEQICSTSMGEYKDGISACSDALAAVLVETASMIQTEVSSTVESSVSNDSQSGGNKSVDTLIDTFTSKTNLSLKNFRIGWQQLPTGIACICVCPMPEIGVKKEVLP